MAFYAVQKEREDKEMKKQENGITLIALVVTIIVLLILAGVAINLSISNNGLFKRAQTTKTETRAATVEEAKNIWRATKETDKFASNEEAETLEELIDNLVKEKQLTEDEKDKILGNEEKGIEAEYKITIGSRTIQFIEMINFSIGEDTYSVIEGTKWKEFFSKNFPGDYSWAYNIKTGAIGCYRGDAGGQVSVNLLENQEKLQVYTEELIKRWFILCYRGLCSSRRLASYRRSFCVLMRK